MQWYKTPQGMKRLKLEKMQMDKRAPHFSLYVDETENLFWKGWLKVGGHCHEDVRLVYNEDHPFKKMEVYILQPKLPKVNIHIHEDGSICYISELNEWNPNWTAFTVYLTTIRFLDEFYSGRMK